MWATILRIIGAALACLRFWRGSSSREAIEAKERMEWQKRHATLRVGVRVAEYDWDVANAVGSVSAETQRRYYETVKALAESRRIGKHRGWL